MQYHKNTNNPRIAVVFIAWRGYPLKYLREFLHSYQLNDADIPHELVIVLKGLRETDPEVLKVIKSFIPSKPVLIEMQDEGVDLWAYLKTIKETDYSRILFLNTRSRILCHGWLRKMSDALDGSHVGMVGAFGSWESGTSQKFPNPCMRTNGFMADRELLLNLDWGTGVIDREAALLLESGPNSLTSQVTRMSMAVNVVDSSGHSHTWKHWPTSRTFRSFNQENLLIADNRSDQYVASNKRQREWLRCYAWTESRPPNPFKYSGFPYWYRVIRTKIIQFTKKKEIL